MSEWEPIETAPEGKTILAFKRTAAGEQVIYVGRCEGGWFTPHPMGPYASRYADFSHWMPLPAEPADGVSGTSNDQGGKQ